MSFIGPTEERKITTTAGKTFKLFLTQQVGGYYVATVLYAVSGTVCTSNEIGADRQDAYDKACKWILDNIDKKAVVEVL